MEITGRRYDDGQAVTVCVRDGVIESVEAADEASAAEELVWIAPGLFDLQVNGYGGVWFSNARLQVDEVRQVVRGYLAHGVTRLFPTLVTNSYEALEAGFRAIDEACREDELVRQMVPGCHLEGPYISAEDGPRGAHPLPHVRPPDWDEFQRLQAASGDRIKLLTLAPEWPGAADFIRQCVDSGVVVAIGHTAANSEQIAQAVEAGARLSTHLGNGAHGMIRRHPNYIWDQLGDPQLWASLITDGHHLPDSVVRSMMAAKGLDRVVITCDASGLAGCPPGRYDEGEIAVEILEDGRLVLAGQAQLLAGSGSTTEECVARAVATGAVTLAQAWDLASSQPCRLCGLERIAIQPGCRADLVEFRMDQTGGIRIERTTVRGRVEYEQETMSSA